MEYDIASGPLTALTIFAGMRDKNIAAELLRKRRDIMIESPAYELIKLEGIREGIKEGFQKGVEEGLRAGKVEEAKALILEALRLRFGEVPVRVIEALEEIDNEAKLRFLHQRAILCKSIEEFERELEEERR